MMGLFEKILAIYPQLSNDPGIYMGGIFVLKNDLDGAGDYIAEWTHPTLPRPTEEQLAAVTEK